ncbi:MAG: cytochrome c [Candidatus Competibacteraceae bacterium]|nr:cytochrome c [Candidatus Competibacteraceae bacterium]
MSRRTAVILIVLGLVIAGAGYGVWYKLFREVPQRFATIEEYYKYGSIGTEPEEGLPYWVWLVLPRAFAEFLPGPGGYQALGLNWEEGRETPVGLSKKVIGFPRVGINCAVCHSASYRTAPDAPTRVVPTGPMVRFDPQAYLRFLARCAQDTRFNADYLLPFIEYNVELSWLDKLLYRYLIIPRTREGLLEQAERMAWTWDRPRWGPGRIDPFNPVKFHPHLLGLDPEADDTIGNSDVMPLWAMAGQKGYSLHWDGLNTDLTEVVLSGAIGDGARPDSLPVDKLAELEEYLRHKAPPPYPFLERLDPVAVARGEAVFRAHCADCHGPDGTRTGTVIPQPQVGTDPHRLAMWTSEAARRYNRYAQGYDWDFDAFVKTDGYVAKPLDGLWLRAPYLHNGSVPTLADLLSPPDQRPEIFYRGYDVYLPGGSGFVHQGEAAAAQGFAYDTRLPGNGNAGHPFGSTLADGQKRDLIEYLKTL